MPTAAPDLSNPASTKQCVICRETKTRSEFYNRATRDGKRSECKQCYLKAQKKHCAANQKSIRARRAEIYKTTKHKWVEYYEKNRDRILANRAISYAANATQIRERVRNYFLARPGKIAFQCAKYRSLKKNALTGNLEEIKAVYSRSESDSHVRCYLCGKHVPIGQRHVDHVIPLRRGGKHEAANLAIACARCNRKKGARLLQEFGWLDFERNKVACA